MEDRLDGQAGARGSPGTSTSCDPARQSTTHGRTLAHSYDAVGIRVQTVYPDGGSNALAIACAYDTLGRVMPRDNQDESGATIKMREPIRGLEA